MNVLTKALSETLLRFRKSRSEEHDQRSAIGPPKREAALSVESPGHRLSLATIAGRMLVFLSGIAAVYLAVGSWMFPEWFFGFIWRAKIASLSYWGSGVSYWLDEHPNILAGAIAAAFVLLVLAYLYRRLFLPSVDRFRFRLVGAFFMVLILTAVLDYKYARSSYEMMENVQQLMSSLNLAMGKLFSIGDAPAIEPPINFLYLDQVRVESLYNQIEPELVEKQRTVVSGQSMDAKGNLSTGPASAEVGIAKKREATSSFERSTFSSARKCTELMEFVLEQNRAHYYTNGGAWYIKASTKELRQAYDKAFREAQDWGISKSTLEKLQAEGAVPQTAKEKEAAESKIKQHELELKAELSSLSGLVVVEATFDVHRSGKKGITLTEVFTEKPERVTFKVVGLNAADLGELASKSKSHLRVFGSVTEPLGDAGVVEIEAIAAY